MKHAADFRTTLRHAVLASTAVLGLATAAVFAADMPMWGMTPTRNMVSQEKNPPTEWDAEGGKNIRWSQDLGSKAYGNPIITNGIVLVGTNNEGKKDPRFVDPNGDAVDGGVLMAFSEKDGKFLWQRYTPKHPAGRVIDWPGEGLCSTVYAESNRIWFCTNKCEVVCADISEQGYKDVWVVDMMKEHGVFPHNMTSAAIAAYGDLIYVITGNGVDDSHKNVVAPHAPGIICFDKNTGKKIWSDNSPGANVLHGQWSSVAIKEVNGRPLVIAPLGDAWVYAYDAKTGEIVWKFDANPKNSIYPQTRNEIISTPVIIDNRMYIGTGQDPEHGTGYALYWCVDITKKGDISAELSPPGAAPDGVAPKAEPGKELVVPADQAANRTGQPNPNSGVIWKFDWHDTNKDGKKQENERMHRTISTAAVHDGLVFVADFSGYLHCLDATTGAHYWGYDVEADIWGSPLVVDGKVYIGDGDGEIAIFEASKDAKEPLAVHSMGHPVYSTPVMSNGTLYIMTMNKLFAIQEKK